MVDPAVLQRLFDRTLELPQGDRAVFLDQSCSDDTALRLQVERLISAYERLGSVFDSTAPQTSSRSEEKDSDPHQMSLAPGAHLGPYVITSAIGWGGMGEVYKARDSRLNRTVALKVLAPELTRDPLARERLEREAQSAAVLAHPHICTVFDIGHQDDVDYLVMEYLEGETLADSLRRGSVTQDQALTFGIQIADALAAAHRAGIIHRDLKPGNIMLTRAGTKLLDFGLAKATPPTIVAGATATKAGTLTRRDDAGNVAVYGARTIRRTRGRLANRRVCVRARALRDVFGQARV